VGADQTAYPTLADQSLPMPATVGAQEPIPTGNGMIQLNQGAGSTVPNDLLLKPFGVGAGATTFNLRVYGWSRIGPNPTEANAVQWTAVLLCEIAVTLGTGVGLAGGLVDASHNYATSLSLTTGNSNVDVSLISPGSNLPAWAMLDVKGFNVVQVVCSVGTATSGNALYKSV
jgi:hypothetical protein